MKLILLLLSFSVFADEVSLLKSLSIEHEQAVLGNRTPYIFNDFKKTGELNLLMESSHPKFESIYNNTRIRSMYGKGEGSNQFRFVGLESELGVTYKRRIDLYFRHFSGHVLDSMLISDFPQDNSIGLRLKIYER